jgi:tRNA dimethylallyltransferase
VTHLPGTERRVIAVVGATATGKSAVAESVASRLGAEVTCLDSRQLFRELEIGTGKPTPAERTRRPHHLFEALGLDERPSAGWYARSAAAVCRAIHERGRPVVLVGGTGLYLRALRSGLAAEPAIPPGVRERLRHRLEREGAPALHAELVRVDPATAARLDPHDAQRITRALEVVETSGKPLSWWHAEAHRPGFDADWRVVELWVASRALAARIESRTRWMLAHGLIEETRSLLAAGRGPALRQLRAIGYDEALEVIEGLLDPSEAAVRIDVRTRRLAKRQRTWFRHQVDPVRLDATDRGGEDLAGEIVARVAR